MDWVIPEDLFLAAYEIQGFAYETPERNRFIGTPGLDKTMQFIEHWLEGGPRTFDWDYYDISRDYFEYKYRGKVLKL